MRESDGADAGTEMPREEGVPGGEASIGEAGVAHTFAREIQHRC